MFERQERVAFLLLIGVAVAVIAAHMILGSFGKQPFSKPFTNNSADGELVHIEGTIDQVALTKTGGHMTLEINNITIFVPAQAARDLKVTKGANISAYGIVETYRGKKEIMVNSADDISFVKQE
jgi:DNA/RNA endonuclease YhcR with UshA esterase domain